MKKFFILITIVIIFSFGAYFWISQGLSPADPFNKKGVIFVVEKGISVREIANKLKKEGLIKDPIVFFIYIKKNNLDGKIQAGDFRLSPSMSLPQIAENLTHGTIDIWITIPEGQRAQEIADTLESEVSGFQTFWRNILDKNEGYLFPDTYLIPKNSDINLIINMMKNNFEKKFSVLEKEYKSNLTKEEIVILASIIEREAKYEKDRPFTASVLLNRVNLGMPLQVDATVQYLLGYQKKERVWWKKDLTLEDLKTPSSYNTYLNPGIPPGPISNPGLAALKAVLNPAKTDYLYYISNSKGELIFAKTLEGHNQNIRKYGL